MFPQPVKRLLLILLLAGGAFAGEPTVTLDVKDGDVRTILKSMQEQCGVRNLLIDKDVQGKGSLYIRDVPCENAFRVVFQQFGLAGSVETILVHVERREH